MEGQGKAMMTESCVDMPRGSSDPVNYHQLVMMLFLKRLKYR